MGHGFLNPLLLRIMGKFWMSMVGKDFEKGLAKLKSVIEWNACRGITSIMKVEEVTVNPFHYLAVRDTASIATISMKLGLTPWENGAAMKNKNWNVGRRLFAIYYSEFYEFWHGCCRTSEQTPKQMAMFYRWNQKVETLYCKILLALMKNSRCACNDSSICWEHGKENYRRSMGSVHDWSYRKKKKKKKKTPWNETDVYYPGWVM